MEVITVKNRENSIMDDLHSIIEEKNNTIQANVAQLKEKDDLLSKKDVELARLRAEIRLKQSSDINVRSFDFNWTRMCNIIGVLVVVPIIASIFFRSK